MTNFSGENLNAVCGGPQGGGMDSRRNGVAEVSPKYLAEVASSAVPAGYKQTEMGVIPADWDCRSLGDLCSLKSGLGITSKNIDGISEYRCYGGNGLRGYTKQFTHEGEYALIGRQGALCGNIQHVTGKFFASEHALVATPNKGVNSKWLAIYLERMNLNQYSESSAQPGLSAEKLRILNLIAPTSHEQTAIANALSDVDALISEMEKLIAKKQAIKTATMQQLLTGRTRLPQFALRDDGTPKDTKSSELGEVPEDWEVVPFGNTLSIRHGKNQKAVENANGTIPIFATGGQIGWADQYLWNKPSVLIGRKGTIDKPRFSDQPFWTVDTLFYSEIKDCADPKFIFYKFCMIDWMQYNEASGVPSLNASTIERVLASLPPKEEQTAIATILSDMDAEIQALEQRLGKTRQIKQGMMQELLTGKTRLIKGEAHG